MKKKLPPKVHIKDNRYYFVDKNKWTGLSRVDEGIRELHRRLATMGEAPTNTMAAIFVGFGESDDFKALKPATQKQYAYFLYGILMNTFGHLMPSEFDDGTIAQYLEKRKKAGAPTAGNREKATLAAAFEWAMRNAKAKTNPCRGVSRNTERPRKTFIESADLRKVLDRAPDHFARVMQLAYMTGMRAVDLRLLKVGDITPEGIWYTESKTGHRVAMAWSDKLRTLIREILEARHAAMNRPYANPYKKPREPIVHDFVLVNRFGKPCTEWQIISNMRRLDPGWSFRDIRPKAQTDAGDSRNVLGHTGQMRALYTRRKKLVPVH
jgi:integrase